MKKAFSLLGIILMLGSLCFSMSAALAESVCECGHNHALVQPLSEIVPMRAEPCDYCSGTLRAHSRTGSWENVDICPVVIWQMHQAKYEYIDYICDQCGTLGYTVKKGALEYRCTAGVCY
ncbi:MAG: hypothetical protein ACI4NU_03745 [Christensenellales bacterium]|nr:hypothetical protein [bacterium]